MSQFLTTVDDALRALAEARTPEQLIDLANTAETLRRYAQRARLGMAAQIRCAEIRLRAERKLGQYLAGTPGNSGGHPKPVPLRNGFPTLDGLGITRKFSHRAQRLAEIPAKDFDWYLRTAAGQGLEITTRLLLYHSERRQATAKIQQRIVGGRIDDLIDIYPPLFSGNEKLSNGDAFSAVAPDMDCQIGRPGGPRCRAVPWIGRHLSNRRSWVNGRSQNPRSIEIAHRRQGDFDNILRIRVPTGRVLGPKIA